MGDDELLFAACLAEPGEDTPRLALADWFDEHDEPELAAALRPGREVVAFLAALVPWDRTPHHPFGIHPTGVADNAAGCLAAARLLTRYRARFPTPPGARTEFVAGAPQPKRYRDPLPPFQFLWQWQSERGKQIAAVRESAARAADRHPARPCTFTATDDPKEFEEQSCLLHELVLRGHRPAGVPGALDHAARMRARGHRLAWLPLELLAPDSELGPFLPRFGSGGYSMGGAAAPPAVPRGGSVGGPLPAVAATERVPTDAPLFACVRSWADESNACPEGAVFRLAGPLPSGVDAGWFAGLPADPLRAAQGVAGWSATAVTVAGALAHLFGAAQSGGAYGRSSWGAYARLHAWQSLGALAGCSPDAPPESVAAEAGRCEWFAFDSEWFVHIAWDLGVLCVRPDRRSVAVLAASDTD